MPKYFTQIKNASVMIDIDSIMFRNLFGITFINKICVHSKLNQMFHKIYFEIVSAIIMYLPVIL